jgi:hypothetical protein
MQWRAARHLVLARGGRRGSSERIANAKSAAVAKTSADYVLDFFFGAFLPSLRASESPMAIACFRLFTVLPLRPLLRVPSLRSCIAFSTFFEAPLEYFLAIVVYLLLPSNSHPQRILHLMVAHAALGMTRGSAAHPPDVKGSPARSSG